MVPISCFVIICLLVTGGYLVGILRFLNDHEENKCDMTYMFEYPQFVRIFSKSDSIHAKYGLYAYSEGRFTQRARQMRFDGIPVLFIPGNAGSYKQVRSFASVALRKSLDSRPGFHFDFFTLELNNELSGLNGALFNEQMEYAHQSIARILELYKECRSSPTSVIVMGHSMGGIIARGLLAANCNVIPLIITLATPHKRAPFTADAYMAANYDLMGDLASSNATIVTLSGGYNDFMVAPFFTVANHFENINVVTTSIPLVWLSVDHLCILWCKQLVLAVTRSLFDSVDLNTKQISLDSNYRRRVFEHHLINHNGIKVRKAQQFKGAVSFSRSNKWIENLQKQYTVSMTKGTKETQWHMIRLFREPTHESLTILALNLKVPDWIFACDADRLQGQTRICSEGISLSNISEIAPSVRVKRRVLQINLHELKKNYTKTTHVVVRVPPTSETVILHMDIYNEQERKIESILPNWWTFARHYIFQETPEKIMHYQIVLPNLLHVIQTYELYVEPVKCANNVNHATATLIMPWGDHKVQKYFTESQKSPMLLRLYNSRPYHSNNSYASIKLTLDPICRYSVSIRHSIMGMLGQLARIYSPLLLANVTAVILLAFRNQLVSIDKTGNCLIFFNAMKQGVKPYYILTLVKLTARGLSWEGFSHYLPFPDWQIIADEGNDFFLLPLLLYMCSVGIVWLSAVAIATSMFLCESTITRVGSRFLARTVTGAIKFSDWLIGGLHKLPGIVAGILLVLSVSTCGGLALCVGCGFYFLKLTQMSQDYVEGVVLKIAKYFVGKFKRQVKPSENATSSNETTSVSSQRVDKVSPVEDEDHKNEEVRESEPIKDGPVIAVNENSKEMQRRGESVAHSPIFFHFSIFLLWCVVALLSLPSVITWAHNFRYNTHLEPDPSFLPGIILSLCSIPLWHMDLPRTNVFFYKELGYIFNVLTVISLIYCPLSVYRLVYIIIAAVVLITVHQLLSPSLFEETNEVAEEITEESEAHDSVDSMKAKLE